MVSQPCMWIIKWFRFSQLRNSWMWNILITSGSRVLNKVCSLTGRRYLLIPALLFHVYIHISSLPLLVLPLKCTCMGSFRARRILLRHLPFLVRVGLSTDIQCSPSFAAMSQLSWEALSLQFRPGDLQFSTFNGSDVSHPTVGMQHQKVVYTRHRTHYSISGLSAILVIFFLSSCLFCLRFKLVYNLQEREVELIKAP